MLPLIIAPNKILRTVVKSIQLPVTNDIKKLAVEMSETMFYYHGIGLAGPQVNRDARIIVITTADGVSTYLNPEIIKTSWRQVDMEEGCLSIPGVFGQVRRPRRVLASFYTLTGEHRKEWLDNMLARVYQHEVDHLNGILFTDKAWRINQGQDLLAKYGLV